MSRGRAIEAEKIPKRLPFREETPLSFLVKKEAHILLCSTIDSWRPFFVQPQVESDLKMIRFDFRLADFPYEKFYCDVAELIRQGAFIYSTNTVSWYFTLHSNLPVSQYVLYKNLLHNVKKS